MEASLQPGNHNCGGDGREPACIYLDAVTQRDSSQGLNTDDNHIVQRKVASLRLGQLVSEWV